METAAFGRTAKGGLCRLALSPEDAEVRRWFVKACKAVGCAVTVDRLGNIFGRRAGSAPDLPPIAIGSHLDTQPTGGRFDGILGVLAGLEVLRTLGDAGVVTRHPLEVVNWTNEEGARFAPAMLAAGVFAGAFDLDYALSREDKHGVSLAAALAQSGFDGTAPVGGRPLAAHFELHIEQGPVLEAEGLEIGVVSGVQGIRWFDVEIAGLACHAGTMPMKLRRDALQAAARLAVAVDEIGRSDPDTSLSTIGIFEAYPGSRNTVPETIRMSVDLRHPRAEGLDRLEAAFRAAAAEIAAALKVTIAVKPVWSSPPVVFDPAVVGAIDAATAQLGYSRRSIVSGAGHDSVYISRVAPTGMIFVPCEHGISHNEAENIMPIEAERGANVLLQAVLQFDSAA
ncbi:MAG: Zn-dependent hydrolase [Novosphingobium sp.]|nr:Zn-dependent hydrolase [Novosphingobium sp.]